MKKLLLVGGIVLLSTTPAFARPAHARQYQASLEGGLLSFASHFLGGGNPAHTHRPWCGDFVNFVLSHTGHRPSGSGIATSFLRAGEHVRFPALGDIAVMRGHVTIFAGWGGRGFLGLGGNQGHGRVTVSSYPRSRVIAWVHPR